MSAVHALRDFEVFSIIVGDMCPENYQELTRYALFKAFYDELVRDSCFQLLWNHRYPYFIVICISFLFFRSSQTKASLIEVWSACGKNAILFAPCCWQIETYSDELCFKQLQI